VRPRSTQSTAETDARLEQDRTASVIIQGHAFVQNLRRGHYELGQELDKHFRIVAAFDELLPVL
jgi:hypothetical protein